MKKYDEYQIFMKYKCANLSFNLLIGLLLINAFLAVRLGSRWEWGTTKEIEILVIVLIASLFNTIISVYHNAWYTKENEKRGYMWFFLISGIINLTFTIEYFISNPNSLLINGKIGFEIFKLMPALLGLSISIPYFIREWNEKRMEKNE